MATVVETIKNFMNVLTKYSQDSSEMGIIALDDAIRTVTKFSSLDEAKKSLVDTLKDTETYRYRYAIAKSYGYGAWRHK